MKLRVLVIGFSSGLLDALERIEPQPPSVFVLEEPSIYYRYAAEYARRESVVGVRVGRYIFADEAIDVGTEWNQIEQFDAILPGKEFAVHAASAIAQKTGLRGPGVAAVTACTDKLEFRRLLKSFDFPTPRYAAVADAGAVVDFLETEPIVLKPRNRHGSLGVRLVSSPDDAPAAWAEAVSVDEGTHKPTDRPLEFSYMVEDYIDGPEYSVESLVRDSEVVFLNVTEKRTGGLPWFPELGHRVPATAPSSVEAMLIDSGRRLVAALGVENGLLHSEWRIGDGQAVPIECAVRFPGDRIPVLIERAYGLNLADGWLRCLRRLPLPDVPATPCGHASTQFLEADPGTVVAVHDLDDFVRAHDVVEMSVPEVGDVIRPARDSHSRPGFAVFTGPDRTSLDAAIESWRLVRVETAP